MGMVACCTATSVSTLLRKPRHSHCESRLPAVTGVTNADAASSATSRTLSGELQTAMSSRRPDDQSRLDSALMSLVAANSTDCSATAGRHTQNCQHDACSSSVNELGVASTSATCWHLTTLLQQHAKQVQRNPDGGSASIMRGC